MLQCFPGLEGSHEARLFYFCKAFSPYQIFPEVKTFLCLVTSAAGENLHPNINSSFYCSAHIPSSLLSVQLFEAAFSWIICMVGAWILRVALDKTSGGACLVRSPLWLHSPAWNENIPNEQLQMCPSSWVAAA